MAIYHLSVKPVQRSAGKSAVAAAAYRSRSKLRDERQGMTFSYTAATDLVHAEIVGFSGERASLWNMAESMETRKDATTAREYEVALPRELDQPEQIRLLREYSNWLNEEYGCVVDFAFHSGKSLEGRENPHGHILTTTRSVDADGNMSDLKIPREWSDTKRKKHNMPSRKTELLRAREKWSAMANFALKNSNIDARIDHRSYSDQGIDCLPTTHLGPGATSMERNAIQTRAGNHNRMITNINFERQLELDVLHRREAEVENLAQHLAEIDAEMTSIYREPIRDNDNSGIIELAEFRPAIADRADKEAAKYNKGVASAFAERFKAKLIVKIWHLDLDRTMLKQIRWVDVDAKALTFKTGEQIVDSGDSLRLSKGSDNAILAAVAMAKSKGWQSVKLKGSDDFQFRAAVTLQNSGIKPVFTSEAARKRFGALTEKRLYTLGATGAPATERPSPASSIKPEPRPKAGYCLPESGVEIGTSENRLRRALCQKPPPMTSSFKDDTRKLEAWVQDQWSVLTTFDQSAGLAEAFVELLREQALVSGYSDAEIRTAVFGGGRKEELSELERESKGCTPRHAAKPATCSLHHTSAPSTTLW